MNVWNKIFILLSDNLICGIIFLYGEINRDNFNRQFQRCGFKPWQLLIQIVTCQHSVLVKWNPFNGSSNASMNTPFQKTNSLWKNTFWIHRDNYGVSNQDSYWSRITMYPGKMHQAWPLLWFWFPLLLNSQLWLHCWSAFCWISRFHLGCLHKTQAVHLHLRPFCRKK